MSKVAILTDSNSGITQEEAEQAGIYVFPTPVYINDEVFYEGVDLTTDQFFARQAEGAEIKTSMPVVGGKVCLRNMMRSYIFLCPADSAVPVRQPSCWLRITMVRCRLSTISVFPLP